MMTSVLTPVNLTLLLVAVGCLFGGIRCKGFSLGIVCVLFVAIGAGVLLRPLTVSNEVYGEQLIAAMQTFSALGTSVFVAVTGLCAGLSFAHGSRGGGIAFLVGCLMSCAGYTVIRIIDILDPSISCSVQGGILCGALTSTPGLSSICERPGMVASQAVRGYGCTYLGGVLSAVFAVRLCRTQKTEVREAAQAECADGKRLRAAPCVTVIGVCALFGNLLGSLILPGTGGMLGATGGILGTAMLLGCGLSKGKYVPDPPVLRIGKNLFYRNRSQCGITDTRIATHDGFIRTFGDVDGSCGRILLYGTFFRTVSPAPRLCDRRRNDQQSRARNAFTEMCGSAAVPVFRRLFRRAIVPDSPALFFVSVPKRERRCPHVTPAFDAKMLICDRRFLFGCSCSDKPFHIAEPA